MSPYNNITPERQSAETSEASIEQHGKPLSEAMSSDAIHPVKITANTAPADVVRQQSQAGQSSPSIPVTSTEPTANAVVGRTQTGTAKISVTHPGQPDGVPLYVPLYRAAQLEPTSATPCVPGSDEPSDCAPAGGNFPQTPSPDPILESWNARQEALDSRLSARCTNSEYDIVAERMDRTGENQSEAIRAIIRESQYKTGNVQLQPKGHPKVLEEFLGELCEWRQDFSRAKSRLGVLTPANGDPRYAEVTKWRAEANRLLAMIPRLEKAAEAALASLSSLTPKSVILLDAGLSLLVDWEKTAREADCTESADFLQALINLLADAGITKPEAQK